MKLTELRERQVEDLDEEDKSRHKIQEVEMMKE
jgi:hypothetical protein